jgi:hypothetical protein
MFMILPWGDEKMNKPKLLKSNRTDWGNITAEELRDCMPIGKDKIAECIRCNEASTDDIYICRNDFIPCGDCRYRLRTGGKAPPKREAGGFLPHVYEDDDFSKVQFNGREHHQRCRSEKAYRISREL